MPDAAGIAGRIAALEERLAAAEGERAGLAALRERAAALGAELATLRAEAGQTALRRAERDAALADARAERDRLLALVEQLAAERRLKRQPWRGLRAWWRRLVEHEGGS